MTLTSVREPEWLPGLQSLYKAFFENTRRRPDTSIGWETCTYLYETLRKEQPARILDTGSGLSTLVIAYWANTQSTNPLHISIDTNAEWLRETQKDLRAHSLSSNSSLLLLDEFLAQPQEQRTSFDFIFVDHGPAKNRHCVVDKLAGMLHTPGTMILDDWHKPHLREGMSTVLGLEGLTPFSVRETTDRYGRYVAIVRKEGSSG